MLQTLKNAWNTKEIRSKILFTFFILLLYRIGTVIPVPFVEANTFASSFSGTILDYMNTLSGGALGTATLFALGVQPYINASIIIQLLAVVFPKLGELAKNDKEKMNFITRITTVIIAVVTAIGYYFLLRGDGGANSALVNAARPSQNPGSAWFYGIVIVACYCAGASLVMWLAERINERGIGNGISIILFANIVAAVPSKAYQLAVLVINTYGYQQKAWLYGLISTVFALAFVAFIVALVIFVIHITGSERRIPIQYAKKVVGRKMYGGQNSNLPIKLNMTGVMPIIFASSIVSLIPTILALCRVNSTTKFWGRVNELLAPDGIIYPVSLFILIIAFAYFYTQITFDPMEVSNNLKKQGGTIPGIRQGRPTADYIRKILNKITLAGALFLGVIAVLPVVAGPHALQHLINWIVDGSNEAVRLGVVTNTLDTKTYSDVYEQIALMQEQNALSSYIAALKSNFSSTFTFGGTSLLIVVGVAIETFRELEAQLTMRNYKGFL